MWLDDTPRLSHPHGNTVVPSRWQATTTTRTAIVGVWALLIAGLWVWVPGFWADEAATISAARLSWSDLMGLLEVLTRSMGSTTRQ